MKHHAHIAHHTKGRLRVRVPSAKGDPAALDKIKHALGSLTGVDEVQVNEHTGSVTVLYDPKRHIDFEKHLATDGEHSKVISVPPPPKLSEIDEMAETLEREAEYLSSHSHSAKAVFDFLRKCDVQLKKATDNQIDLKVLTPLALAAYAFLELGIEAATPVWLTLGVFSFNHFVDLHTRHEKEAAPKEYPPEAVSVAAPQRRSTASL